MKLLRLPGVCVACVAAFAASVSAQSGPVAVPIVGSPAAQQPATAPAQPPQIPPAASTPAPARPAVPTLSRAGAGTQRKLVLSLENGTMGLEAQNVTVREVLAEWQRRSGCQFVNADKLPPTPVTLQFPEGTPQLQALDSLLRGLGAGNNGYGYIVGPRRANATGDAACGAVYILASSRPSASATYVPPASPLAAPLISPGSPDDEIPPVVPYPPGAVPGQPRPVGSPVLIPNQPPQVPQIPPQLPPQLTPGVPSGNPAQQTPPPPQSTGFGPVAPSAPGAGGSGAPPQQQQGGRGGNQ
jgi:hypothetical protein